MKGNLPTPKARIQSPSHFRWITVLILLLPFLGLRAQPANDDPCNAIALTVGASCTFSSRTNAGATATPGIPAPGCASYNGGDVWFTAVVPANGQLIIDSNTGGITDGGMALYSATACGGTFTLIECDDDDSANGLMPSITRTGLAPGSTVYIRFWEFGGDNNGTFSICAYSPPPPPPACGTVVTDPGGAGNYGNNANFVATYCPAVAGQVVTITFTAFATEAIFDVVYIHNGPSIGAPVIGTYSGTTLPPALTSNDPGGCLTLRFTSDGSINAAGWTANITCGPPPPPPANDNPCGAIPLTVNASCTFVTGTTLNATNTSAVPPPPCANYVGNDVWYSATVPASGQILVNTNTGVITDGGMALYTASGCSGTFTLIECDDDDSPNGLMPQISVGGLTPGSTVYIRIWENGGDNNGTFSICATNPPPAPANDNPCGATLLPVNTSCVNTTATTVNAMATAGPPAPTCANYAGGDVWFRMVVPASGDLIIETNTGGITDGGMALYTAPSCAGPFTQEICDDDGGTGLMPMITASGLAPGSTVYVRFWEYGNDNPGTFTICARTPPPPPTGDCVYVLNLFDSFGDGWGSSNVGVRINGGAWTYYTVGGSNTQVLLGMMIGDFIELSYDASGPYQYENSFSLGMQGAGVFFNSGASPPAGPSFAQLVNCQPPPAAPQDCNGGTTICNGQAFNNNSSNTGNIVDLNTANQGCLSSGERQGTWYYFSPSASGTVGFTIAPVTATDYDFAVWGPMSSVSCPPASPPVRCSYAAPTGPTGLGNGAGDTSEGAGGDRWVSPLTVTAGQVYILYVDNFSSNGQAFDLTWQLSGGASLDCTVLPVELVRLQAAQSHGEVNVTWSTLSESDSHHFLVERSFDGEEFHPIGTVDAAINSTTVTDYLFVDKAPRCGTNHYRITMVDLDGSSLRSNTVNTTYRPLGSQVMLMPNPAKDMMYVTVANDLGAYTMRIMDATGRTLRMLAFSEQKGPYAIPVNDLDPGAYMLVLTNAMDEVQSIHSFVKE